MTRKNMRFLICIPVFLLVANLTLPGCKKSENDKTALIAGLALLLQPRTTPDPQISVGRHHTCIRLGNGAVRCWGRGFNGQLGYDNADNVSDGVGLSIIAAGYVPLGGAVDRIEAGAFHTCALFPNGAIRCAGNGSMLGYNSTNNVGDGIGLSIIDAGDVPVGGTVKQISTESESITCALLETNAIRCWGFNNDGDLGYNNTTDVGDGIGPTIIDAGDVPVGGTVKSIATGAFHACALLETGTVRCWGEAIALGYNDGASNVGDGIGLSIIDAGDVPVGGSVKQLAAGEAFTCALLETGAVRCWGTSSSGQLGHGNTTTVGNGIGPTIIDAGDVPVGGTVKAITAGQYHVCALLETGSVRCWGKGGSGQLGYNSTSNVGDGFGPSIIAAGDVPVGDNVMAIDAGGSHTCALLSSNELHCWGLNGYGQLGYDNTDSVGDGIGPSIQDAGEVHFR